MKNLISILLIALIGFLNAQTPVIPDASIKWGVNLENDANDYKGNCHGASTGCTFTGSNTGVIFTGTNNIQFSLTSFTLGGFFFSEYFNFKTVSADTMYLFGNSDAARTPSSQSLYAKIENGYLTVGFWQNLGLQKLELTTPMQLNDDSVHSVVFNRYSSYTYNLYIDGNPVPVATKYTPGKIWTPNKQNSHFTIGRLGDYTSKGFNGTINKLFIIFGTNQTQINYLGSSQTNPKGAPFNP